MLRAEGRRIREEFEKVIFDNRIWYHFRAPVSRQTSQAFRIECSATLFLIFMTPFTEKLGLKPRP